jgi:hypothetical protein
MRSITIDITGVPVDQEGTPFAHGSDDRFYFFGVCFDTEPDDGPGSMVYGPPFYAHDDHCWYAVPVGWIQAWLTRIQPNSCPLYAQRVWRPGQEATCDIRGYQRKHTKRDRARAEYALELLTHVAELQPGRPRRDEALARQIASWHDDDGLTHKEIAKRLGWPLSPDAYGTPCRSAAVQEYINVGRRLRTGDASP